MSERKEALPVAPPRAWLRKVTIPYLCLEMVRTLRPSGSADERAFASTGKAHVKVRPERVALVA